MNKVVTFLLSIIILSSCQDNAIIQDEKNPPESEYNQQSGMQRIVASSPEEIKAIMSCSKKDLKKAIGLLYKQHLITINNGIITLNQK